jgi:hypothetical protein
MNKDRSLPVSGDADIACFLAKKVPRPPARLQTKENAVCVARCLFFYELPAEKVFRRLGIAEGKTAGNGNSDAGSL